jgi:cbb3-type cytochrome oxidase subunit 3
MGGSESGSNNVALMIGLLVLFALLLIGGVVWLYSRQSARSTRGRLK